MVKLNQIIAVEKGVKAEALRKLTDIYQVLPKAGLWSGISRTYRPKDEEGDQLPAESTIVQMKGVEVLQRVKEILTSLFDVVATKENGNTNARADIVVDGVTLVKNVSVTYLLFLEKQLVDLHTFTKSLPTLDASEKWDFDSNQGVWATPASETVRTKKIPRNHVKAEATEHHPAQVEMYNEDVIVGNWKTIKFSGAFPMQEHKALVERVEKLQQAVKYAREEANSVEVNIEHVAEPLFRYLFDIK